MNSLQLTKPVQTVKGPTMVYAILALALRILLGRK